MKVPCFECDRRKPKCHSTCKEYKEYREYLDGIQEKRQKENRYADYIRTRRK